MKPHHAAALALLGWYLMVPPRVFVYKHWSIDHDAPLPKWDIYSSFDSAQECELQLVGQTKAAAKLAVEAGKGVSAAEKVRAFADPDLSSAFATTELVAGQYIAGRCIATDDPRLKGN
jgi:hypothetical protein